MRGAALLCAAALAGGCTLGPNYQRPQIEVPTAYRFAEPAAQAISDVEWWEGFGDPVLSDLVRDALRNNLDVRIAAARVDIFLGALATTRSALFPQVAVSPAFPVQAARQRGSRIATPQKIPADAAVEYATYQAGLSAAWEIDLWGKVRRQTESATADVFANEEARRGVVLSVAAATAGGYIALRDLDQQLEIARETARSRGDSLEPTFSGRPERGLEVEPLAHGTGTPSGVKSRSFFVHEDAVQRRLPPDEQVVAVEAHEIDLASRRLGERGLQCELRPERQRGIDGNDPDVDVAVRAGAIASA